MKDTHQVPDVARYLDDIIFTATEARVNPRTLPLALKVLAGQTQRLRDLAKTTQPAGRRSSGDLHANRLPPARELGSGARRMARRR
jgi:hypothetical protein